MKLNLEAKTPEEEKIKAYLEANVSPMLADKINNGGRIQKDDKTLLNKKTLADFMIYACDEARKLAEKGANSVCVEDKIVYGWAVHYFTEDSIEGTLFNEDGTKFKIQSCAIAKASTVKYEPPKPKPKPQISFFELLENTNNAQKQEDVCENSVEDDEEPTEEEILEAAEQNEEKGSSLCVDPETGEVLTEEEMREFDGDIEEPDIDENEIDSSAFDVEALAILDEIFGNDLEVR